MNDLLERTIFQFCQIPMLNCSSQTINNNNTDSINYTTMLNPSTNESSVVMSVRLTLPENKFLSLSFTIHYLDNKEMISQSHEISENTINMISFDQF